MLTRKQQETLNAAFYDAEESAIFAGDFAEIDQLIDSLVWESDDFNAYEGESN